MHICMDFRFAGKLMRWAEKKWGERSFDLLALPGIQKAIIDKDTRPAEMKAIRIGVEKHGVHRLALIAHQDCGAYGGSRAFTSWNEEKARYIADLREAAKIIRAEFPDLKLELLLLTFDAAENISVIEIE